MREQAFDPASRRNILKKKGPGIDIFFLGVGSAFAQKHYQNNYLIVKGDTHVLVDFGMTGPRALQETAGLKPTDIEIILPTHSHADHVGGVECLALMNRYITRAILKRPQITMVITEEYQRVLWNSTLRGGLEHNEARSEETGSKMLFSDYFDVIRPRWKTQEPREIFEVTVGDIELEIFRTKHVPEQSGSWETSFVSFGLFIKGKENIFLSGDTRFDRDLIDHYADKSAVMFHDVQFFPGAVHAPLEDLKTLPQNIKDKMLLMHYADNWQEQDISDFAGYAQQGLIYSFD
ncbi:MAG: MBL fold metallo-hydrolase [Candidatus Omnitrophica bacterium]|nr:MBL fold metallo-hydrolase [Candidatus Omnitrophota bacterium]